MKGSKLPILQLQLHAMVIKYYLIIITLITFFAFGWDKRLAKNGKRRLAESVLLILTFVGGTFGALIGMTFLDINPQRKHSFSN